MGSTTYQGTIITWLDHASVKLRDGQTVCIDPFSDAMPGTVDDADLIICTHSHFDHFDPETINDLVTEGTVTVAHESCDIGQLNCEARLITPGDKEEVGDTVIRAVQAYNDHRFRNPGEPFHPPGQGMGVIVDFEGTRFYHAGDTDYIDEMDRLDVEEIDVAFLPIGGTYTMDVEEAVEAAKAIQPDVVIPIHYNMIDGTEADPQAFKREIERDTAITVQILQPED
ncbi:MAG: MBL fold metallo-hydrolase [Candidatus Nanohaloarchaea archaeon]|nr:MBL fold metallo-hydrolase [Candidatus Nanohaloarchaea archaeon]